MDKYKREMYEQMREHVNRQKAQKKYFDEGYSGDKLKESIKTKLRTSFIGAISKVEENFGHLWGHNNRTKTDSQKEYLRIWEILRKQILDNGNCQIRLMEKELESYSIKNKTYKYNFKLDSDGGLHEE